MRRSGRTSSLSLWPTSLPTTWRRLPDSMPWMTRTRSSSDRPGRSMETYSERSAAGFIKSEAAVPKERQPQLLWSATELWKGGVSALLRLARQAGPETGVPPGLAVVGTMRATASSSPTTMNRLLARVIAVYSTPGSSAWERRPGRPG